MNDIAIIRDRLARRIAKGEGPHTYSGADGEDARQIAAWQRADGSWPGVNYDDRARSHWDPALHLARTIALERAACAAHGEEAEAYWAAAGRALHYWVTRCPESDNWWHNDIGAPTALGSVLLMLGERADPDDRAAALAMLARVEIGKTGQNRVWLASINLVRGLLTDDEPLVRLALDEVLGEIRVTEEAEGIQPDWSFHQHGPQLYQGNYGAHFVDSCAPFATLLQGTAYAMPPEKIEILSRLALEGTAWLTWNSRMDYHVVGRFITSPERSRYEAQVLVLPVGHLAEADPARRDALLAFQASLTDQAAPGAFGPMGNRHYWRSDVMVHRDEGRYWSIRMSSERTVRSEACNGEGLQNYHLGDGVTFLWRSGEEYDAIFPVWDWRRLPGVTCRLGEGPLPVLSTGRHRGSTAFVGGVSDGGAGVAAMDHDLDGLRAHKAWFSWSDTLVCLGAGVTVADGRVATSINQCLLRGPVAYGDAQGQHTLAPGQALDATPRWVHHDGIGYLLLDGPRAMLQAGEQRGSWGFINSNLPEDEVAADVFSLWLDHGEAPKGGQYAYAVRMGAGWGADAADEVAAWAQEPGFVVLANTTALQAVRYSDGVLGAAFFRAGALDVGDGGTLAVDRPCLVLLRGGRLYVSDPTHVEPEVRVTFGGREVRVALPTGAEAGRTVEVVL